MKYVLIAKVSSLLASNIVVSSANRRHFELALALNTSFTWNKYKTWLIIVPYELLAIIERKRFNSIKSQRSENDLLS